MSKQSHNAIGIFDSGLGGLTVVRELVKQLPHEHIIYYGDTARVPYGTKSKEAIIQFSQENTQILLRHKVKIIIVACNSSSSYSLITLRRNFSTPFLGVIRSGAKKAAQISKNKKIGIIATSATIASQSYNKELKKYDKKIKAYSKACPLFVPLVESGWFNKKATFIVAEEYLSPLKKAGIDTLILGCTHYPLLKPILKKIMGKGVYLVDSAKEVALEVKQSLETELLTNKTKNCGKYKFLISDKPQDFQKIAKNFLNKRINIKYEMYK